MSGRIHLSDIKFFVGRVFHGQQMLLIVYKKHMQMLSGEVFLPYVVLKNMIFYPRVTGLGSSAT